MRRSSLAAVSRRLFFPDVKAVWYSPNVASQVPDFFSIWSVRPGRQRSKQARERFRTCGRWVAALHRDLIGDAERYSRKMEDSKRLPPLLIDIRPSGQMVVWDGNRRCLGYMLAGQPEGVVMPAYFIERRKRKRVLD